MLRGREGLLQWIISSTAEARATLLYNIQVCDGTAPGVSANKFKGCLSSEKVEIADIVTWAAGEHRQEKGFYHVPPSPGCRWRKWNYPQQSSYLHFLSFFLVQNNWYVKQIPRGGWSGFGMVWSWDRSQLMNLHPNHIPTSQWSGGVVQFCPIFIFIFIFIAIFGWKCHTNHQNLSPKVIAFTPTLKKW